MHLKTGDVETDPGATVTEIASPNSGGAGHLLLHFAQHPTAAMVRDLTHNGIQVLGDVPDNGLLVMVAQPADVSDLGVDYAAPISPETKISPLIATVSAPRERVTPRGGATVGPRRQLRGYFIVEFHPDTEMNRARGRLLNM